MSIEIHVIECDGPPINPPTLVGQHWIDTTSDQTWLAVGTSSVGDWVLVNQSDNLITATVPAGNSITADTTPIASLCVIKYIVCLHNQANNKWAGLEMLASKKTVSSVEDTIYSKIGSILDVDFDYAISGSDAELTITNNEAFDVEIKIHKNLL